jgi:17beta-estradiol 17-dehydrogenase / very-long-chain 3-oxoacyl-CoA reductase
MISSAAKNSLFPLFVVGPDACARAAVRWIGHGPLCVPNLVHQLQWWAAAFLPEILGDTYCLALHLHRPERIRRATAVHQWTNSTSNELLSLLRGAVHEKEIYKWWSYPFLQEDEGHVEM